MTDTIGNPLSWFANAVRSVFGAAATATEQAGINSAGPVSYAPPVIRTLRMSDLRDALREGAADFVALRTDVMFACLLYPLMGVCLFLVAFQGNLLQLVFPILSGFALLGPFAAVGLYEMSRRRERGIETNWLAALDVIRSPAFGAVFVLGLFHIAIFAAWLMVANIIFDATLGPEATITASTFVRTLLATPAGWTMIVIGCLVGFGFALVVLGVSVVSFPLLLDRDVGVPKAIVTSAKVALANPAPIAVWGFIIAVGLALGSAPALLGLVVVLPILGHATWHLYRKAIVPA